MRGYVNWRLILRSIQDWWGYTRKYRYKFHEYIKQIITPLILQNRGYILLCVCVVALLYLLIYWDGIWEWLRAGGAEGTAEPSGVTLRNLALIIAGGLGLGLASWRSIIAHRQIALAERSHQNERYQKAADMLGSATFATRMDRIFALERLAKEHPDEFHIQAMDLLASFARLPTKDATFEPTTDEETNHIKARADVLEAGRSISRREKKQLDIDHTERSFENMIDLTNVKLQRVFLGGTNLSRIDFGVADLTGTSLIYANLSHAYLSYANLSGANLTKAVLSGANLRGVKNLTQKQLVSAYSDPDNPPVNLPEGLTWPEQPDKGAG